MTTVAAAHDLIHVENRRTPKIVPKGGKYEPSEAEGKITKRRPASEDEEKVIKRGDWVRVNEHGDKPGDPGYKRKKSKVRPQPNTNSLAASGNEASGPGFGQRGPLEDARPGEREVDLCTCCGGTGEHQDGHECYVCDAGMSREAQMESKSGEFCEGHHGVPDDGPENAKDRYGPDFEHSEWAAQPMLNLMLASAGPEADGYDGVTHAGIAVVAKDTGRVLLAQRSMDATDEPDVQETWEFPGGGLDDGEEAFTGAVREFCEETQLPWPMGEVIGGWRSDDGIYQGFVWSINQEFPLANWTPTDETQALTWMTREQAETFKGLRPEVESGTDWDMIFESVSGNEEPMTDEQMVAAMYDRAVADDIEPDYSAEDFDLDGPIPVHGVVAPEGVLSGDGRGFGTGAMNRRPLALPFRDQPSDIGGHNGAHVVGRVDRMMRKDGLVHWEGALMPGDKADAVAEKIQFFGGRYGVSVDGDQGALDMERSGTEEKPGPTWFSQVRAAGLTAVDIPAFHEAYVAFGLHPEMPNEDDSITASLHESGDMVGLSQFGRGPGYVTNPVATNRLHDYWTKPGQPGYAKVGWGTPGDFTRAKKLIGAKIAEHSPDKMKYLNQIIAQWHFDALGYWPGDLGKPGNAPDTAANRKRAATHAKMSLDVEASMDAAVDLVDGLEHTDDSESVWEAVLVSSAAGAPRVPLAYFHRHPDTGATAIEEPDALGFRRVHGYAAEWGVCHIGMDGRCVEPPRTGSDDYPDFHLGITRTAEGKVRTGLLTYGVGHRDAQQILTESATQAHFDNIRNAWAAVRIGEDDRGIWYSGVVLPKVDEADITLIQASGQVSGEWKRGALRACLTVNVPGFPVVSASAEYDEEGNVMAMAASAFGQIKDAPCSTDDEDDIGLVAAEVMARIAARDRMQALAASEARVRMAALRNTWEG